MSLYLFAYVLPIVATLLTVPLALGKVPPNRFYGFRTQKTPSSPAIWYPANRIMGWFMIAANALPVCFDGGLWSLHPEWPQEMLLLWMVGAGLLSVLAASILSLFYLRKL